MGGSAGVGGFARRTAPCRCAENCSCAAATSPGKTFTYTWSRNCMLPGIPDPGASVDHSHSSALICDLSGNNVSFLTRSSSVTVHVSTVLVNVAAPVGAGSLVPACSLGEGWLTEGSAVRVVLTGTATAADLSGCRVSKNRTVNSMSTTTAAATLRIAGVTRSPGRGRWGGGGGGAAGGGGRECWVGAVRGTAAVGKSFCWFIAPSGGCRPPRGRS